jgi:hypothetical protein
MLPLRVMSGPCLAPFPREKWGIAQIQLSKSTGRVIFIEYGEWPCKKGPQNPAGQFRKIPLAGSALPALRFK